MLPRNENCPPSEALMAFAFGLIDEVEIDLLAQHFEECQSCAAALDTIGSGLDTQTAKCEVTLGEYAEFRKTQLDGRIGRYEIISLIAKGGMSRVYRAFHPVLKKTVALKTLSSEISSNPQFRDSIIREQEILGKLSHPNIVTVYDAGFDGDTPFIVMELVEGESLASVIAREGALQQSLAIEFALTLAEAIQEIHSHGLVHRDIKPSNVMIDKSGSLKLLDLGLAIPISQLCSSESKGRAGTPGYIAPEQRNGTGVDHRADIYGLGATIFTMLRGRLLKNESELELSSLPLAESTKELLNHMLQQNRDERPESIEDVVRSLRSIFEEENRPRKNKSSFAIWGVLTLLVFAASVYWARWSIHPQARESTPNIFVARKLAATRGLVGDAGFVETATARPTTMFCMPSSSGRQLATFGFDGCLRIYELSGSNCSLSQVVPLFSSTDVDKPQLTWIDGDSAIVCSGPTGEPVRIWDVAEKRLRHDVLYEVEVRSSCWEPTRATLAIGDGSGRLRFYDATGSETDACSVGEASIEAVCCTDSKFFIGTSEGELLQYSNGRLESLETTRDAITALGWCPAEQTLIVGTVTGVVSMWKAGNLVPLYYAKSPVNSIATCPDGSQLAVGSYHVDVLATDGTQGRDRVRSANQNLAARVGWIGGDLLVTDGVSGVRELDLLAQTNAELIPPTDSRIVTLEWASTRNQLAVGTTAGGLWVVNADGQVEHHAQASADAALGKLAWSPNGEQLVGLQLWSREPVVLWNASREFQKLSVGEPGVYIDVAWFDDSTIATLDSSGQICISNVESNSCITKVTCDDTAVCISYCRSNALLTVGHSDGSLQSWEFSSGKPVERGLFAALENQFAGAAIRDIAWSPNGEFIAVCSRSGGICIGSAATEAFVFHRSQPYLSPQEISWAYDSAAVHIADFGTVSRAPQGPWELQWATHRHFAASWYPDQRELSTGDWMNTVRHFNDLTRARWTLVLEPSGGAVTLAKDGREISRFGLGPELVR